MLKQSYSRADYLSSRGSTGYHPDMFKLIKLSIALGVIAALSYFTFKVPLGKKTLYEHLVGITKTDEAQVLGSELGKKVDGATKDITREIKKHASKLTVDEMSKGRDKNGGDSVGGTSTGKAISKTDRESLDNLIKTKVHPEPNEQDKKALNRLLHEKNRATR